MLSKMLRIVLLAAILLAPLAGCSHHKSKTVQRSERIEESEPRMTSPGTEVIE